MSLNRDPIPTFPGRVGDTWDALTCRCFRKSRAICTFCSLWKRILPFSRGCKQTKGMFVAVTPIYPHRSLSSFISRMKDHKDLSWLKPGVGASHKAPLQAGPVCVFTMLAEAPNASFTTRIPVNTRHVWMQMLKKCRSFSTGSSAAIRGRIDSGCEVDGNKDLSLWLPEP